MESLVRVSGQFPLDISLRTPSPDLHLMQRTAVFGIGLGLPFYYFAKTLEPRMQVHKNDQVTLSLWNTLSLLRGFDDD